MAASRKTAWARAASSLATSAVSRAVSAFEVDFELPGAYVAFTLAGAVLVSLSASLHPAARAVRADAAESIHYE